MRETNIFIFMAKLLTLGYFQAFYNDLIDMINECVAPGPL